MRRLAWNLLFCTYSPQSSCQNNHPLTPILWLPGSAQVPWFFKDHVFCIGDEWVSNSGSFPTLLFSSLLLVCETQSFPGRTSIYVFANYVLHNCSFIKCSRSYSALESNPKIDTRSLCRFSGQKFKNIVQGGHELRYQCLSRDRSTESGIGSIIIWPPSTFSHHINLQLTGQFSWQCLAFTGRALKMMLTDIRHSSFTQNKKSGEKEQDRWKRSNAWQQTTSCPCVVEWLAGCPHMQLFYLVRVHLLGFSHHWTCTWK